MTPEQEKELRKLCSTEMRDALAELDRVRVKVNTLETLNEIRFKGNDGKGFTASDWDQLKADKTLLATEILSQDKELEQLREKLEVAVDVIQECIGPLRYSSAGSYSRLTESSMEQLLREHLLLKEALAKIQGENGN